MTFLNTILLSGWFQIAILGFGLFMFSKSVLSRRLFRGYALGWMVSLFFIFVFASLNPPRAIMLGGYDGELALGQVLIVSVMGFLVAIGIGVFDRVFSQSYRWKALEVALITAMLVIALFVQVATTPDVRIMVSLFVLAFAMASLTGIILSRSKRPRNNDAQMMQGTQQQDEQASQQPPSRVNYIRQRILKRVNRNDVPANHPISPN